MTNLKQQSKEDYFNPFETPNHTQELKSTLAKIDNRDLRCKFKSTTDPIHLAFDTIESTPLKILAVDFVKESFMDIAEFISSFCR